MTEQAEFSTRYQTLDELNRRSWYMTEAERPFTVNMSLHSVGAAREKIDPETQTPEEIERAVRRNRMARFVMAGNMSTVRRPDGTVPYGPANLTDQERYDDAMSNTRRFLDELGVDPATVRVLNPERDYTTPLTVVNVDEDPAVYTGEQLVQLQKSGDFIYSYNPNIVFGVRPADCPIAVMTAETPKGRINMMIHFAWRGPASGQIADMQRELEALDVDKETLRVYITPGGQAESYEFKNYTPDGKNNPAPQPGYLFRDISYQVGSDGLEQYSFRIDTPYEVYQAFRQLGLNESQLCIDTTDTTSLESGTASHSRARNQREDNVRDLIVVQFHRTD